MKSFFDANLALTQDPPRFEFYDAVNPIYTSPRFLPPAKLSGCTIKDAIISHGCFLQQCKVTHSIVGLRARICEGAVIEDALACIDGSWVRTSTSLTNSETQH